MKSKLKLDKNTIQAFLLEHVEKIVLGVIGLAFLSMVYFAITGSERFNRSPEELVEQVRRGQDTLRSTPANSAGLTVQDYASQAKQSRIRIEEKPYSLPTPWDKPLFERRPPRAAPPLFAVQDLRGAAGVGAFRMSTKPAEDTRPTRPARPGRRGEEPVDVRTSADDVRGQRWVVVTGLVPVAKQEAAYAETFKQSIFYDPQNDFPTYLGYWVERVEVADENEAANPDWSKAVKFMSKRAVEEAVASWGQSRETEVVAQEHVDDRLTFPLGPLVNRAWDANVAHAPEIPLHSGEKGGMRMGPAGLDRAGPIPPRGERLRPTAPLERAMPGGRDRPTRGDDTEFGDNTEEVKEPAAEETKEKEEPEQAEEEEVQLSYKLFRFFDFSVEPGKQYVYRVCLALENPNRGLKPTLLAAPELATEKMLKTNWSEPTPVISVPRDGRVLVMSVSPPRPNVDQTCKVLVVKWLKSRGIEAYIEKPKVVRGQVANYPGEKFRPTGAGRRSDVGRGMGGGDSARELSVDFTTGITVVDFRGGEQLPGKPGLTAPGEILLLNPDGSMSVRNELEDTIAYEELTSADNEPSPAGMEGPGIVPPRDRLPPTGRGGLDDFMREAPLRRRP